MVQKFFFGRLCYYVDGPNWNLILDKYDSYSFLKSYIKIVFLISLDSEISQ